MKIKGKIVAMTPHRITIEFFGTPISRLHLGKVEVEQVEQKEV